MFASVEIFNVENGESHIVLETDTHVEAPNWTSDGKALILNGEGRLYRLELDAPTLQLIDTGELEWLNNDHGISPDGQTIVVSDSPRRGTSIIYTLPVEGGTPDRVTEHAPSWWHGWSPDGAILAYTCVRNKQFGVAVCPAKGGFETVLISSPHHYDGPDYTPDGEWIWFNSDRSGCMDLWRMRADGGNPERMTQGDSVDWFPHPSPDGKHVCYLAYPAGTTGHPFGRDVELRLIPSAGGTPRTLLGLFGGQGTINVPSWAPDSRSFAFVRYSASRSYGLN
jgi:Tol biopolymer transport system component